MGSLILDFGLKEFRIKNTILHGTRQAIPSGERGMRGYDFKI
jgi:hypothetical protein